MRTRRSIATPFLQFSQFNATSVRLRGDTYYTVHPHDDVADNGNDGCGTRSLYATLSPNPLPLAHVAFVCSPYAAVHSADLFPAFFLAFSYRPRTPETSKCDKAAKYPSEECWIVRSLIYDSVRGYRAPATLGIQTFGKSRERARARVPHKQDIPQKYNVSK